MSSYKMDTQTGVRPMTFNDKIAIESAAKALVALSRAEQANPELARILDRIAIPGGDWDHIRNALCKVSGKYAPDYERQT